MNRGFVLLESVAVGVPGRIQPVSTPALAVVRGREESVDDAVGRARRVVGQKGVHFLHGRRKAHQIEVKTPQESDAIRLRRRDQARGLQSCADKGVDRVASRFRGGRHFRPHRRGEGPVIAFRRRPRFGRVARQTGLHENRGGRRPKPGLCESGHSRSSGKHSEVLAAPRSGGQFGGLWKGRGLGDDDPGSGKALTQSPLSLRKGSEIGDPPPIGARESSLRKFGIVW